MTEANLSALTVSPCVTWCFTLSLTKASSSLTVLKFLYRCYLKSCGFPRKKKCSTTPSQTNMEVLHLLFPDYWCEKVSCKQQLLKMDSCTTCDLKPQAIAHFLMKIYLKEYPHSWPSFIVQLVLFLKSFNRTHFKDTFWILIESQNLFSITFFVFFD